MSVSLIRTTKNAEQLMAKMARVSSKTPENSDTKLLKYLLNHKHWSPFEMCHMTVQIETTRDISRQIIRHRSFSFQEFSQRYQDVNVAMKKSGGLVCREARMQDTKNRQNSVVCDDEDINTKWRNMQENVWQMCIEQYNHALLLGIAREQARSILPEGLTKTVMYMSGSIRSWIHYINLRSANGTQKEHMDIANKIKSIFIDELPTCSAALGWTLNKSPKKRKVLAEN